MTNNSEEMINESPAKNQGLAARKRRFSSEKTANCRTCTTGTSFVYQSLISLRTFNLRTVDKLAVYKYYITNRITEI